MPRRKSISPVLPSSATVAAVAAVCALAVTWGPLEAPPSLHAPPGAWLAGWTSASVATSASLVVNFGFPTTGMEGPRPVWDVCSSGPYAANGRPLSLGPADGFPPSLGPADGRPPSLGPAAGRPPSPGPADGCPPSLRAADGRPPSLGAAPALFERKRRRCFGRASTTSALASGSRSVSV